MKLSSKLLALLAIIMGDVALAQDTTEPEAERQSVLSDTPFGNTRTDGFAGALSPIADSTDAAISNPAGIGGLDRKPPKKMVRQLHFPLAYGAFNENSQKITETIGLQDELKEADFTESVTEALADKPQYSRASIYPNVGIGRFMAGPIYDIELTSTKPYEDAEVVDLAYQKKTGGGAGFSIADPKGHLFFGVYAHYLEIERLRGLYTAEQVATKDSVEQILDDDTDKYQGVGINAGAVWKVNHDLNPAVSLRAINAGGTNYNHVSGPGEDYSLDEDLGVGFGISPEIFQNSFAHLTVETSDLTNGDLAVEKKWHVASGLTFGGRGVLSICGVNLGFDDVGVAYGGHLNIGLIGVQYANFAVDVGTDDYREIERRQSGTISINLAQ